MIWWVLLGLAIIFYHFHFQKREGKINVSHFYNFTFQTRCNFAP